MDGYQHRHTIDAADAKREDEEEADIDADASGADAANPDLNSSTMPDKVADVNNTHSTPAAGERLDSTTSTPHAGKRADEGTGGGLFGGAATNTTTAEGANLGSTTPNAGVARSTMPNKAWTGMKGYIAFPIMDIGNPIQNSKLRK